MNIALTAAIADLTTAQLALFHSVVVFLPPHGHLPAGDAVERLRAADDFFRRLWEPLLNSPDRGRKLSDELVKIRDRVRERLEDETAELIEADKRGLGKLTELGGRLNELAEQVLADVRRAERRADEFRIAASEAASTYVFPDVLRDMLDGREKFPRVRTGFFRSPMVEKGGAIERGEIDLAIAWDTYTENRSDKVNAVEIRSSRTAPCVIFHPLHPFGQWYRMTKKGSKADLTDKIRAEVAKHNIVYPGALRPLAESFARKLVGDRCTPVESFPAVVTHTAMRVGIGLFPSWPHLLDKLKREVNLLHVPLPVDTFSMTLVHFQPLDRPHPMAGEFVTALEQKLAQLNSATPEETAWRRESFDRLLESLPAEEWDAYYINVGDGEPLFPHWRKGEWKLKLPRRLREGQGGCSGTYEMKSLNKMRERAVFKLEADLGRDYLRVKSTRVCVGADLTPAQQRPQFLCFQELYTRPSTVRGKGGHDDLLLLGFVTHSLPGRPTVAPFVLCPQGTVLRADDFRQIETMVECHSHAVLDEVLSTK